MTVLDLDDDATRKKLGLWPLNPIKAGDKIAANPIVHVIGKMTGCIDPITKQLKKDSACNKMKTRINAGMSIAEAMKLRLQNK